MKITREQEPAPISFDELPVGSLYEYAMWAGGYGEPHLKVEGGSVNLVTNTFTAEEDSDAEVCVIEGVLVLK